MAAAPETAEARPLAATGTAAQPANTADRSRWIATLLAAAPRAWDYAISLN